jgi:hypothetical protein
MLIWEKYGAHHMPETDHFSMFGNQDGCSEDILDVFLWSDQNFGTQIISQFFGRASKHSTQDSPR